VTVISRPSIFQHLFIKILSFPVLGISEYQSARHHMVGPSALRSRFCPPPPPVQDKSSHFLLMLSRVRRQPAGAPRQLAAGGLLSIFKFRTRLNT
jgi:hypothetical protein